ncbi:MAG: hypothetical protein IT512_12020 [Rhodocyclaceae bacterium]|nr:hypothetical protein [Rhodocyclaceae bacterium]
MKTLSIRVPYVPGRPGYDGPDGHPVGLIILRLHEGADLERFEDAAGAAEGDLAAALLLERQAELAAADGRPWVPASEAMRARAILDAALAHSAVDWAVKVSKARGGNRKGGDNSKKTRRQLQADILAQVAPLFAAAREKLLAKNYKRPGAPNIFSHARRDAGPDHPLRDYLTRHYAELWLADLKAAKLSKKRGSK